MPSNPHLEATRELEAEYDRLVSAAIAAPLDASEMRALAEHVDAASEASAEIGTNALPQRFARLAAACRAGAQDIEQGTHWRSLLARHGVPVGGVS